ncbi:MAG: tRNA(Met) cytidine acetyltransferase TmcA [bacterium]
MSSHRQLILLTGEAGDTRQRAASLLSGRISTWIGGDNPGSIPFNRVADLLGSECQWLVYDAHTEFDGDAFAIACGLIQGGGGLLLLTPPVVEWRKSSRFISRFVSLIEKSGVWVTDGSELPTPETKRPSPELLLTDGQKQAIDAITHVATGHRRRPALLLADRGRGKSTAMGVAAADLLRNGHRNIVVTARSRDAAEMVFQHAARQIPDSRLHRMQLQWQGRELTFVSPDRLLEAPITPDILLVDEAAALPVAMLEALLTKYARCVFATTIHGYEGGGQGFANRFTALIEQHCGQFNRLWMKEPVRWSEGDPLEQFVFDALLLDAEPCDPGVHESREETAELISKDKLLESETLLRQVFGLLVQAHYRTRPSDLQMLLDDDNIQILIARSGTLVLGAGLFATEGKVAPQLVDGIVGGTRRVKGHMLPQVLAAQMGIAGATEGAYLRVVRIAVHQQVRRQGIASRMMEALHEHAASQSIDLIGTSFGANAGLLSFWMSNGFVAVRLGVKKETTSGEHAVMMLVAVSQMGRKLIEQSVGHFSRNFPPQLTDTLKALPPDTVSRLLLSLRVPPVSEALRERLQNFASGAGNYHDSLADLREGAIDLLVRSNDFGERDRHLWVRKVLQGWRWSEAIEGTGLSGKAQALQRLRDTIL